MKSANLEVQFLTSLKRIWQIDLWMRIGLWVWLQADKSSNFSFKACDPNFKSFLSHTTRYVNKTLSIATSRKVNLTFPWCLWRLAISLSYHMFHPLCRFTYTPWVSPISVSLHHPTFEFNSTIIVYSKTRNQPLAWHLRKRKHPSCSMISV